MKTTIQEQRNKHNAIIEWKKKMIPSYEGVNNNLENNNITISDNLTMRSDEYMLNKQNQIPKYLSASMRHHDNKAKNQCTRCGGSFHNAIECPFASYNLLAPSS